MSNKIKSVHLFPGLGSYYREDIAYLQKHPVPVEKRYSTPTKNPSMPFVRMPAEVICIVLELDSGHKVQGDAMGVSFGGKAGREIALSTSESIKKHETLLNKTLVGLETSRYLLAWDKAKEVHALPLSIQYGVSQALLAAVAQSTATSLAEVLRREFHLPLNIRTPALHGSCGSDRYHNVLKMILHRLPSHPAGQGDDLENVLGKNGEKLIEYAKWWKSEVAKIPDYQPTFHFDLHGLLGQAFSGDLEKIAQYLTMLEQTLLPYACRIESPLVESTQEAQMARYLELKELIQKKSSKVKLVVDEWANTLLDIQGFAEKKAAHMIHIKMPDVGPIHHSLEAVLACKTVGVGTLLGGSCIETMVSARCSYHLALACQPDLTMVKPGMGFDEALSLATNEMRIALTT